MADVQLYRAGVLRVPGYWRSRIENHAGQQWIDCEYSVPVHSDPKSPDIIENGKARELEPGEHYASWNCGNRNVFSLGIYPTEAVQNMDGSFSEITHLYGIVTDGSQSNREMEMLSSEVRDALRICRVCRFHRKR